MLDLYVHGTSPLHRLGAGWKLLALFVSGSMLFLFNSIVITCFCLLSALALYGVAGLTVWHAWGQLRAAIWVFVLIFLAQGILVDWGAGLLVVMRCVTLLLLAGLLTLTTRTSEIINGVEAGLRPFARLGVNTAKVSLAISLTLRFIPVLLRVIEEVRGAQKTRGLERNLVALILPVLVRTIKISDDISDAIDARGF